VNPSVVPSYTFAFIGRAEILRYVRHRFHCILEPSRRWIRLERNGSILRTSIPGAIEALLASITISSMSFNLIVNLNILYCTTTHNLTARDEKFPAIFAPTGLRSIDICQFSFGDGRLSLQQTN
jgi:hypothetical protein